MTKKLKYTLATLLSFFSLGIIAISSTAGVFVSAKIHKKSKMINYLKNNLVDLEFNKKELETQIQNFKVSLSENEAKMQKICFELENEKTNLKNLKNKLLLYENGEAHEANEENKENLVSQIQAKQNQINDLENQLNLEKQKNTELLKKFKQKEQENLELVEKIKNLIASQNAKVHELETQIQSFTLSKDEKTNLIKQKSNEILNLQNSLNSKNTELVQLKTKISNLERSFNNIQNDRNGEKEKFIHLNLQLRNSYKKFIATINSEKETYIKLINQVFITKEFLNSNNFHEESESFAKILNSSLNVEKFKKLLNGEVLLFEHIDPNLRFQISHHFKEFDSLANEDSEIWKVFWNYSDDQYKNYFINNDNLQKIEKVNLLVEKLTNLIDVNLKSLEEAFTVILKIYQAQKNGLLNYLDKEEQKLKSLIGTNQNINFDLRENYRKIKTGILGEINLKLSKLEELIKLKDQKLIEYVGSTDLSLIVDQEGNGAKDNSLISNLRKKAKIKESENQRLLDSLKNKNAELQKSQTKILELSKEIEKEKQILINKESEINSFREQIRSKNQEIEILKSQLKNKDNSISDLEKEKQKALNEVKYWKDNYLVAEKNSQKLNLELERTKNKLQFLTGSSDREFNVGIYGENAKSGSYIYNLNHQIQIKEKNLETLKKEKLEKEQELNKLLELLNKLNIKSLNFGIVTQLENPKVFYEAGYAWDALRDRFNKFKREGYETRALDSNLLAFDKYYPDNQKGLSYNGSDYYNNPPKNPERTYFEAKVIKGDFGIYTSPRGKWLTDYFCKKVIFNLNADDICDKNAYNDVNFNTKIVLANLFKDQDVFKGTLKELEEKINSFNYSMEANHGVYQHYQYLNHQKYKVKQLISYANSYRSFIFRESEIEIDWVPYIKLVKPSSAWTKLELSYYMIPISIINRAYNDIRSTYNFDLIAQNPIPDIVYLFKNNWKKMTGGELDNSSLTYEEIYNFYEGKVILGNSIVLPDLKLEVPRLMVIRNF
ncbi:hypothetical protein [Mycoplasmopsis gallopavonis]|uniref:hypothetical protein n=1 Tax=Mycoplasmopsis gallopavonis TaxID=76629 RepID=UPI000E67DB9F|nr:hypothetical protein [Mycoplasmopsis gallopavonis]RIV16345.1 hypothetical protein D1113_02715 [Mycoplasmopsis gallopavonis]